MFKPVVSANKKANKTINGTSSSSTQVQQQNTNGGGSTSSTTSSFDDYQSTYQTQNCISSATSAPVTVKNGPNLVNKQLVLPFVPPSFPNGSSDSSNHLIKPSEYLKSISDKHSNGLATR